MTAPPTSNGTDTAPDAQRHEPSVENLLLRFGLVTLDQLGSAMREQAETGQPFTDLLVRDGVVSADDLARVVERTAHSEPPAAPPQAPQPAAPQPFAAQPQEAQPPEAQPPEAQPQAPEPARPEPVLPPAAELPEPEPVPAPEPVAFAPPPPPAPVAVAPEPEPEPAPVAAVPDPVAPEPEPPAAPAVVVGYVVRGRLVNGEEIEIASVEDAATAQRIARDAMRACARSDASDWPILNGRYVRPQAIVSIEVAEALG